MQDSDYLEQFKILQLSLDDCRIVKDITNQYKFKHFKISEKNIMASTVYVLGLMNNDHKSMKSIAKIFNTNINAISMYYKDIAKIWGSDLHFY